jgi:hypothetical protein
MEIEANDLLKTKQVYHIAMSLSNLPSSNLQEFV